MVTQGSVSCIDDLATASINNERGLTISLGRYNPISMTQVCQSPLALLNPMSHTIIIVAHNIRAQLPTMSFTEFPLKGLANSTDSSEMESTSESPSSHKHECRLCGMKATSSASHGYHLTWWLVFSCESMLPQASWEKPVSFVGKVTQNPLQ